MRLRNSISCFVVAVCIAATASAETKELTVDPAGGGDFKTVKAAIDSLPVKNTQPVRILIKPGKYEDLLVVPKDKSFINLIGLSRDPKDTLLTYHLKSSDPKPDGSGNVGTSGSSSTVINGSDFSAENLTFENSAGDNVGQAVALKTQGDRLVFRNCRFLGYQDTLYPSGTGRVYFKDCFIRGDTDFIFGSATAVFDHCTIESTDVGYITAANTKADSPYGFVFLDCTLQGTPSVKPASVFLGRPWQWDRGPIPATAFLRTKMGPQIAPIGWHPWDEKKNLDPGKTSRYSEFNSTDLDGKPIDVSKRAPWSHQLALDEAAKYTVEDILGGSDHWNPAGPTTQPAP